MKKTTKTTVNEYDADGKLIKSTQTIVEEDYEYPALPIVDPYPWYPSVTYTGVK